MPDQPDEPSLARTRVRGNTARNLHDGFTDVEIYLVGGAVRDALLGLPVRERDWVVVGSTPEEMLRLGYRQVGRDFPVFLHPQTNEEYALARTERKVGARSHRLRLPRRTRTSRSKTTCGGAISR